MVTKSHIFSIVNTYGKCVHLFGNFKRNFFERNQEMQENKEKEALTSQAEPAFPIAGIGASAGGLDAIKKLLENLPKTLA